MSRPVTGRGLPRRLIIEALRDVLVATFLLRTRSFERLLPRHDRDRPGVDRETGNLLKRAVEGWARRVPWKAECFVQAIAMRRLLDRRKLDVVFHYGSRRGDEGLEAHVWVSSGGRPVIGHRNAHEFVEISTFPPQS